MSRWPDLPPGNRFDAILQLAAEMRAEQRGRRITAEIMRAARAEAQRRARSDLMQVTAYKGTESGQTKSSADAAR